jgi:hypothetical protein
MKLLRVVTSEDRLRSKGPARQEIGGHQLRVGS